MSKQGDHLVRQILFTHQSSAFQWLATRVPDAVKMAATKIAIIANWAFKSDPTPSR